MAPSRIDELRRRVQNDPASIAFAQLAEEYRRSGQTEEAVRVCREGLTRHPGYLSARVTLGRALLDLEQLADAREELQFVVGEAPENLAAVRGLAEIYHREGQTAEALTYYQRALALARHDPEIEEIVEQLSRQVGAASTGSNGGLSFEEAHEELLSAAERLPVTPPQEAPLGRDADHGSTAPFDFDRLVAALGSPSAPPHVEAAVEGRPSTVSLDLPEPALLGPDPFAALEAELRASNQHSVMPKVAPWSSPDTAVVEPTDEEPASLVAPAWDGLASAEEVMADTLVGDVVPTAGTGAEDLPAEAHDAGPDQLTTCDDSSTHDVRVASEVHELEVRTPDLAPEPTDPAPEAAAPEAEPQPEPAPRVEPLQTGTVVASTSEGVLDELESWLTTLQDRPSE